MSAKILDGEKAATQIYIEINAAIKLRKEQGLHIPGLATILIGDNPASQIYVAKKTDVCQKLGMISKSFALPKTTTETELIHLITELNNDKEINGILVQLPLPKHISTNHIIECIAPKKDVDGFHPYNVGRLALGNPTFRSCTPKGIITLLSYYNISNLIGMDTVIIGVSNIVGKPMALELLRIGCTVSICNINTKDISRYVKNADLVISAAGVPKLIKGEWIKENAIVIDVGMNRLPNGQITGDVEFAEAKKKASWITPVPGGVGPMTVASLMENTLLAAETSK